MASGRLVRQVCGQGTGRRRKRHIWLPCLARARSLDQDATLLHTRGQRLSEAASRRGRHAEAFAASSAPARRPWLESAPSSKEAERHKGAALSPVIPNLPRLRHRSRTLALQRVEDTGQSFDLAGPDLCRSIAQDCNVKMPLNFRQLHRCAAQMVTFCKQKLKGIAASSMQEAVLDLANPTVAARGSFAFWAYYGGVSSNSTQQTDTPSNMCWPAGHRSPCEQNLHAT